MRRKILLSLMAVFFMAAAAAQTRTVRGSVVDENDTPVIGATVIVKDSPTLGTSTDVNGEFVLKDLPAGGGGNYRFPMWVIRPGQ